MDKVKKRYLGKESSGHSLLKCYEESMKDIKVKIEKGLRAPGTYENYISALNQLKAFLNEKYNQDDIELVELDKSFIDTYNYYLRIEKKIDHNTIYNYMGPLLRTAKKL